MAAVDEGFARLRPAPLLSAAVLRSSAPLTVARQRLFQTAPRFGKSKSSRAKEPPRLPALPLVRNVCGSSPWLDLDLVLPHTIFPGSARALACTLRRPRRRDIRSAQPELIFCR